MAQVGGWVKTLLIALSIGVPSIELWFIAPPSSTIAKHTWLALYLLHTCACLGRLAGQRKWIVYPLVLVSYFQLANWTLKDHFATQQLLVNYLERCSWFWIPAEVAWVLLESMVLP